MAPFQSTLRRALGTFKDQTSISILKVAGSACTDLDIALVKATSHEEVPIEEKYMQEILHLTSLSGGYVNACVSGLAKRLSKTHNWIVAIKALMLTHRLLRDGDPSFEQELLYCSRRGSRVLNLSNFRDDSHLHAWDYSAFVRTYALFLDEKLDFNLTTGRSNSEGRSGDRRGNENGHGYNGHRDDAYGYDGRRDDGYGSRRDDGCRDDGYSHDSRRGDGYRHGYGSRKDDGHGHSYDSYRDDVYGRGENGYDQSDRRDTKKKITTVKDMNPTDLLERIPLMQRLLERVLACRPTGTARTNRLVQIALYPVVRESFLLYGELCDAMAKILDAFFDMEQADCVKAFEMYSKGAKQIDELASFYWACKDFGVCRTSEYPAVQKISEELLETMDDFLKDRSGLCHRRRKSPELGQKSPEPERGIEDTIDVNGMKALPAPPLSMEEPEPTSPTKKQESSEPDLVNLKDDAAVSADEHGDRLALALFSDMGDGDTTIPPAMGDQPLAGWELALVESTSELSKPATNALAGGFDNLLLTSMYDQALANQKGAAMMVPAGSASSMALMPGQPPASSYLALPAPPTATQAGEDPFVASMLIAPPSYVQMADMRQKQQFLVQEQQAWYQYQRDGMQGYNGIMKFPNPTYNSFQYYHSVPNYYGTANYY